EAGTGVKGHEAEWFGGGAVNHFPDIQVHAQGKLLEFVHQRDVDAAKNIFEQLHHFGRARRTDRHYFRDDLGVKRGSGAATGRIDPSDDLGDLREAVLFVAGIFAFGRKREIKI